VIEHFMLETRILTPYIGFSTINNNRICRPCL